MKEDKQYFVDVAMIDNAKDPQDEELYLGRFNLTATNEEDAKYEATDMLWSLLQNPLSTVKYTVREGYVKEEIEDCFTIFEDAYELYRTDPDYI